MLRPTVKLPPGAPMSDTLPQVAPSTEASPKKRVSGDRYIPSIRITIDSAAINNKPTESETLKSDVDSSSVSPEKKIPAREMRGVAGGREQPAVWAFLYPRLYGIAFA